MPPAEDARWAEVDRFLEAQLLGPDPVLDAARASADAAGLPPIAVSPLQGRLLHLLAALMGARRILEIGTLGGYSAICLARALPVDGRLVTLELEPRHAAVARANLARAGLAARTEIRVGPARDGLASLAAEAGPPFDLVFIDADKASIPAYLEASLGLARDGALIVVDNVVREGAVTDPASCDAAVLGVRRALAMIRDDPRLVATAVQTVGTKGWDGLVLARVVGGR